jgi:death-on-curing protein
VKTPLWIDERDALALHNRLMALDGGATGLRDRGLLLSALARPMQLFAYRDKPDMAALAAAYTAGIVSNHPFIDGNKRTGFLVGVLFLEINGYRFTASEESATHIILALAEGTTNESTLIAWMRANCKRRNK